METNLLNIYVWVSVVGRFFYSLIDSSFDSLNFPCNDVTNTNTELTEHFSTGSRFRPFQFAGHFLFAVQSGSNGDESFSIILHFPPSWLIHASHANSASPSVVKSTSSLSASLFSSVIFLQNPAGDFFKKKSLNVTKTKSQKLTVKYGFSRERGQGASITLLRKKSWKLNFTFSDFLKYI